MFLRFLFLFFPFIALLHPPPINVSFALGLAPGEYRQGVSHWTTYIPLYIYNHVFFVKGGDRDGGKAQSADEKNGKNFVHEWWDDNELNAIYI